MVVCFIEIIRIINLCNLIERIQISAYREIYTDERDKDYLWHKPNIDVRVSDGYYDFTIKTNSLGHRSLADETKFEKSIVFVGDSIIEGAPVENDETIPYIVGQTTGVATVNLGVGSSNTVQEYLLTKEKILPEFSMNMLVLGFCLNDIAQNKFRRNFNPVLGNWEYFDSVIVDDNLASHSFSSDAAPSENKLSFLRRMKVVLRNSEAVLFLYMMVKNRLNIQSGKRTFDEEAWKNTEYFLNKLSELAVSHNAKFEVIIFPYQDQIEGRFKFDEQNKLKQILERKQIRYFDPTPVLLENRKNAGDASNMYHDNTHPNKHGMLLIAKAFSDYIIAEHFNADVSKLSDRQ